MRIEQEYIVKELSERYQDSTLVVASSYHGLTAEKMNDLRARVAEVNGRIDVAKNTLIMRAFGAALTDEFAAVLAGPNAIAMTQEDSAALAKVLVEFAKENEALNVQGGFMDMANFVSVEDIKSLAELPSRDILLSMLLSALQGPMRGLAGVGNGLLSGVVRVLDQIAKTQKDTAAPSSPAPDALEEATDAPIDTVPTDAPEDASATDENTEAATESPEDASAETPVAGEAPKADA